MNGAPRKAKKRRCRSASGLKAFEVVTAAIASAVFLVEPLSAQAAEMPACPGRWINAHGGQVCECSGGGYANFETGKAVCPRLGKKKNSAANDPVQQSKKPSADDFARAAKKFLADVHENVCGATIKEALATAEKVKEGLLQSLTKTCDACFTDGISTSLSKPDLYWLATARGDSKGVIDVEATKAAEEKYKRFFETCTSQLIQRVESAGTLTGVGQK